MAKLKKVSDIAGEGDNSSDLTKAAPIIEALLKLETKKDDLRMQALALYNQAEDCGIDRKALKVVVKDKKKAYTQEFKEKVNAIREAIGETPLFAYATASKEAA